MIIRTPEKFEIDYIVRNMREWDKREIFASFDPAVDDFAAAYAHSVKGADLSCVAYTDTGFPVALFSVLRQPHGRGQLQLLATDRAYEIILPLTRHLRHLLKFKHLRGYRRLECHALKEWDMNTRWLQLLGGVVEAEVPNYGANGEDFLRVVWN